MGNSHPKPPSPEEQLKEWQEWGRNYGLDLEKSAKRLPRDYKSIAEVAASSAEGNTSN